MSYQRRATPVHKPEPTPDPVRKYRVLSARWKHPQGEVFELAFPAALEKALLDGGIIELADDEPEVVASVEPAYVFNFDVPSDRPLKSADKEG